MKYTLYRDGLFYKGNLHLHTNVSDGELSPADAKEVYKNAGYKFLAITDHNKYGIYEELNENGFLVIPGIEIDSVPDGNVHHVVGISTPEETKLCHGYEYDKLSNLECSAQELVDFLCRQGNYAIYAHPAWSYADLYEIKKLKNILGVEILNYSCNRESFRGDSEVYFEQLCSRNENIWGFCVDDAHGHVYDYFGGYISVKAKEFTHRGILDAIKDGSFYSSYINNGDKAPEIMDFYVENGVAKVVCSPCKDIYINGIRTRYVSTHSSDGDTLTYTEKQLSDNMEYVRVICVDSYGNTSWSQPIKLK